MAEIASRNALARPAPAPCGNYFRGRLLTSLLHRLQRIRWGFSLAPHLGQRHLMPFQTALSVSRFSVSAETAISTGISVSGVEVWRDRTCGRAARTR